MSFIRADGHPDPDSPEDPLHYAPRSARSTAVPQSVAAPQTGSDELPPAAPLSRFDEMREEAFAKSARPLQSQFDYERRSQRGLLAAGGAIAAAAAAIVILALALFNAFPKPKSEPPELAVSISTPASATPSQAMSEDSQALLQGFKQFQGSESPQPAASEPAAAGNAKEGSEKSEALLGKFMQWQQGK